MSLSLPQEESSLHKLSSRSQYRRSSPETIGATENHVRLAHGKIDY
jgi:hypothetical protein